MSDDNITRMMSMAEAFEAFEAIVKHIGAHAERESVLLYGKHASWTVDPVGILRIIESYGVSAEQIDAWLEEGQL